ncbi:MAG: Spy/CpxP family protein refolding chaperone [bacterium]
MNVKRTALIATLAAALGIGFAGTTFAHGPGGGGFKSHRGGFGHIGRGGPFGRIRAFAAKPLISISLANRDELKLTPAQAQKLTDLRDGFIKRHIRERAEIKVMRLDLRRALDAENVDLADVEKQVRAIAKIRADLRIARLGAIDEGRRILTAEQQEQLRTLVRQRSRRHGMGMGMEMGMGMGRGMGPEGREGNRGR